MDKMNKKSESELSVHDNSGEAAHSSTRKRFLIFVGVALGLILIVWLWKSIQVSQIRKSAEQDKIALNNRASKKIIETNEDYLKLLAKPIVWSMRTELMQGNLNQVNLYISDLIKEKNFQRIVVANEKGEVLSSTDKKDEGQALSNLVSEATIVSEETLVENVGDSILIMTSPIMGFNNRLGTLYINYKMSGVDLDSE